MKHQLTTWLLLITPLLFFACSGNSGKSQEISSPPSSYSSSPADETNEEEADNDTSGCKFEDGTHSASVNYHNSRTGYSTTYTLDVEVQDCQIVQINFPNGGHLDEDHISAADLDEDGNASVEGEDGKSFEIQISR
jgi:hypothetical protein